MTAQAPVLWVVLTTVPNDEDARRMAHALVEQRLAACVQAEPVHSVYRWNGAVEEAGERRLTIKTTAQAYPALEAALRRLHPYDVPQIVALPAAAASADYADWVRDSVVDAAAAPRG